MSNKFLLLNSFEDDIPEFKQEVKSKPKPKSKPKQTLLVKNKEEKKEIKDMILPSNDLTEKDLVETLKKIDGNPNNWGDVIDATDILQPKTLKPKIMLLNAPKKEQMLSPPIALIHEYQDENKQWYKKEWVIHSVEEMWNHFKSVDMVSAVGCNNELANKTFDSLLKLKNETSKKKAIDQYNALFPAWTIVKLPLNYKDGNRILDPFIRENGRAKNIININLKQTKEMTNNGLYCFKHDYTGFIPTLMLLLIGNNLPDEINGITFNQNVITQTIRSDKLMYKGWRVRLLTTHVLDSVKSDEMRHKFSHDGKFLNKICEIDNVDYSTCIVNITN